MKAANMEMGFCKVLHLLLIAAYASGSLGFRSLKADTDQDPHQVHISLVGSDHIRVSWITEDFDVPSLVEYGTSPGKYTSSATGNNTSYSFVVYKSGSIHNVVIGPLAANTIYYYRCGGFGAEYNLKTSPSKFPITFAIVGDPGQTDDTKSTLAHIQEMEYDVFLSPGDLSYADIYQPLWDSFGELVEPLASSRPWMVAQGNHEVETIPLIIKDAFRKYNARWRMPFEQSGSSSNLFYSFEVAGVHVMMLGSYADSDPASDQYKWLQGEGEDIRKAMEELLYSAKVDMVFAGHVHAYERFSQVYNNKADPCGALHITIGDGGNREGLASKFEQNQSELSLFREANFGHGELIIMNATHAFWRWHRISDGESVAADQVLVQSFATSTSCVG